MFKIFSSSGSISSGIPLGPSFTVRSRINSCKASNNSLALSKEALISSGRKSLLLFSPPKVTLFSTPDLKRALTPCKSKDHPIFKGIGDFPWGWSKNSFIWPFTVFKLFKAGVRTCLSNPDSCLIISILSKTVKI